MNRMKNKWSWWVIGSALIGLIVYSAVPLFNPPGSAAAQTADTVESFIGQLNATTTATGQLEANVKATLSFAQSGSIADIMVDVGDEVQAGDPLARLDDGDLQRAVADAEQTLVIQQNRLATLLEPAADGDLAAANANLVNAQTRLADLQQGGSANDIAAQQATVQAARAELSAAAARLNLAQQGGAAEEILAAEHALAQAQEAYTTAEEIHRATYDCTWQESSATYDCEGGSEAEQAARVNAQQALANLRAAEERLANLQPGGNELSIASAQASLTNAQATLNAELARLAQLEDGGSAADLAAAEAAVARAQKQLDDLLNGPTDYELIQQETAVAQAEISLIRAQNNLAEATLVAPFDGVVTAVHVALGQQAGGVAIELVKLASLEAVLAVDEIDLASLALGQPAKITLESYPDQPLTGELIAIAPENAPNTAGTVVYDVRLALDPTELNLLEGMTADAQLVTEQRDDVVLVPNGAIKVDRSQGVYSVDVVTGRAADGSLLIDNRAVTIGVRDSQFTEIISGLEAGTELAVGYTPPPVQAFGPGS